MQRIKIAAQGPEFSRIALGMWRLDDWNFDTSQLLAFLEEALELGFSTIDHADIYGNYSCEEIFGQALAKKPALRQKMQLVTKCGIRLPSEWRPENRFHDYNTSREHIIKSLEHSLKNLRTDYLDVLLIHRPDPLMDADEVASAFSHLKQSGKVRYFGVSNFTPFQFDLLQSRLDFPLVTNQVEISVLKMDTLHDGTLDQCQQVRISPMAWSPFGGGRLFSGDDEQAAGVREVMQAISGEHENCGIDQLALAWLLKHPSKIVPVLGSGRIERIRQAAGALDVSLSREEWFRILTASAGNEVP